MTPLNITPIIVGIEVPLFSLILFIIETNTPNKQAELITVMKNKLANYPLLIFIDKYVKRATKTVALFLNLYLFTFSFLKL
jgi:hypothetical protein